MLPDAGAGISISQMCQTYPDFLWEKLPEGVNEICDVGLTCRVARASIQGADMLSQKYRCAKCGFAVGPCLGLALVFKGNSLIRCRMQRI